MRLIGIRIPLKALINDKTYLYPDPIPVTSEWWSEPIISRLALTLFQYPLKLKLMIMMMTTTSLPIFFSENTMFLASGS